MSNDAGFFNEFWGKEPGEIFAALESSPDGLTSRQAADRQREFGANLITAARKKRPLALFFNQLRSPIMIILIIATIISLIAGEKVDAVLILLIVFGSSALSYSQEKKADDATEALKKRVSIESTVLRDGRQVKVSSQNVVPGDIVFLAAGTLIPADGIIIAANNLQVNQSVLTGETFPVMKNPGRADRSASLAQRSNCVYLGTNVRSGSGKMLVVHTGQATEFGEISKSLSLRPEETDFEKGIRHFGMMLSEIMLVMVLLVFGLNIYFQKPFIDSLLFSIALAVGLTPQLLPAIISINLSKGAQVMAQQGVIVKKLNAIENFGSMDIFCTDKTGTLTIGEVGLEAACDAEGNPSTEVGRLAFMNALLQEGMQNPLDDAIKAKFDYETEGIEKVSEIPYDFVRKRLSIVVRTADHNLLITKGAFRKILEICSRVETNGEVAELEPGTRAELSKRFDAWSDQGFRVLAIARKDATAETSSPAALEKDMIFTGFLLFYDPPKKDAAGAVAQLEKIGIALKVITGDNERVTRHIATEIGLPITGTLSGAEMGKMQDDALLNRVETANLFVEVDPNQKERIISALRKRKHIVGYMGDGINDAPSILNADVGISVDQAVDVAKDAADFVLINPDLSVLEKGVGLGRTTFANTMKYINVTTSANFGNMFSMAGLSILLPYLPLLPFQVLLLNFLTDLPGMMIAGDSVDEEVKTQPRKWDIHSIRRFMYLFGGISSVFDYLTFFLLLVVLKVQQPAFRTGWFMESTLTELTAMIVLRTPKVFFRSNIGRSLLLASLFTALLAMLLPTIPGINEVLGFTPLDLPVFLVLIGISLAYALANEITKRWFFRQP